MADKSNDTTTSDVAEGNLGSSGRPSRNKERPKSLGDFACNVKEINAELSRQSQVSVDKSSKKSAPAATKNGNSKSTKKKASKSTAKSAPIAKQRKSNYDSVLERIRSNAGNDGPDSDDSSQDRSQAERKVAEQQVSQDATCRKNPTTNQHTKEKNISHTQFNNNPQQQSMSHSQPQQHSYYEPYQPIMPQSQPPYEPVMPQSTQPRQQLMPQSQLPYQPVMPQSTQPPQQLMPQSQPQQQLMPQSPHPQQLMTQSQLQQQMSIPQSQQLQQQKIMQQNIGSNTNSAQSQNGPTHTQAMHNLPPNPLSQNTTQNIMQNSGGNNFSFFGSQQQNAPIVPTVKEQYPANTNYNKNIPPQNQTHIQPYYYTQNAQQNSSSKSHADFSMSKMLGELRECNDGDILMEQDEYQPSANTDVDEWLESEQFTSTPKRVKTGKENSQTNGDRKRRAVDLSPGKLDSETNGDISDLIKRMEKLELMQKELEKFVKESQRQLANLRSMANYSPEELIERAGNRNQPGKCIKKVIKALYLDSELKGKTACGRGSRGIPDDDRKRKLEGVQQLLGISDHKYKRYIYEYIINLEERYKGYRAKKAERDAASMIQDEETILESDDSDATQDPFNQL